MKSQSFVVAPQPCESATLVKTKFHAIIPSDAAQLKSPERVPTQPKTAKVLEIYENCNVNAEEIIHTSVSDATIKKILILPTQSVTMKNGKQSALKIAITVGTLNRRKNGIAEIKSPIGEATTSNKFKALAMFGVISL